MLFHNNEDVTETQVGTKDWAIAVTDLTTLLFLFLMNVKCRPIFLHGVTARFSGHGWYLKQAHTRPNRLCYPNKSSGYAVPCFVIIRLRREVNSKLVTELQIVTVILLPWKQNELPPQFTLGIKGVWIINGGDLQDLNEP